MESYEAANLARDMPRRYADRLPGHVIDNMDRIARGGETLELLDVLVAALTKYEVTVTAAERDELATVLTACDMPAAMLDGITVTG